VFREFSSIPANTLDKTSERFRNGVSTPPKSTLKGKGLNNSCVFAFPHLPTTIHSLDAFYPPPDCHLSFPPSTAAPARRALPPPTQLRGLLMPQAPGATSHRPPRDTHGHAALTTPRPCPTGCRSPEAIRPYRGVPRPPHPPAASGPRGAEHPQRGAAEAIAHAHRTHLPASRHGDRRPFPAWSSGEATGTEVTIEHGQRPPLRQGGAAGADANAAPPSTAHRRRCSAPPLFPPPLHLLLPAASPDFTLRAPGPGLMLIKAASSAQPKPYLIEP